MRTERNGKEDKAMSNFNRAVKALDDVDEYIDHLADNYAYVTALEADGLLVPDLEVIHTQKELEAVELNDPDAIAVAGEAGEVRHVRALAAMYRLGSDWCLPAVVVARGRQVRAAREAMEQERG